MINSDKNFDPLAERLKKNVYNSDKGLVRLSVLKHDMFMSLPELSCGQRLDILDAGGGMGQIARWLAEMGHNVVLCDLSQQMLELAAQENARHGLSDRIKLIHSSIQDLPGKIPGRKFSIILLHGVIEWMESPEVAIDTMARILDDNGAISLLFFNRDKLILKWGINGQFANAKSGVAAEKRKLTPHTPLSVKDILLPAQRNHLEIASKAGIRIFYGFFARMMREYKANDQTIELEKQYCRQEPFASLGEHTHLVLRHRESH